MRILAVGIHPDDVELGCGATVILAVEDGHDVAVIDLSDGSASSNGTVHERTREAARAAEIMGVRKRMNLGLPDLGIRSEDPKQLQVVVAAIRESEPDVVLLPSSDDPHPDHASGGELLRRALYLAGIRKYQPNTASWSVKTALIYPGRREVEPQVIVDVTSTFGKKMLAIQAHETQFITGSGRKPTPLNSPEFLPFIEARGRLYGQKIRTTYGEPFRLLNPVAIRDLGILGL